MKAFRQGQILKIINAKPVHTQEELARELTALGVPATQVTLSRDLRELGLVKTKDGYMQLQEAPEKGAHFESAVNEYLLDIRPAQNSLVLKTPAAHANSLAIAIDHADAPEVAGTIAGDDTVLVVCTSNAAADAFHARLVEVLKGSE
ncbi:MAG: ArgR family transcriptional regulator [Bryobacterales bacterium]|nr:ArgR family transcriptional regulator [Bryobacterales bacterium]